MAVSFWELDFTAVGGMVERLRRAGEPGYLAANPEFVRELSRATQVIDVNDLSVSMFGRGEKEEMLAGLEPYWPEASFSVYAAAVVAAVQGKPHFAAETRLSSIDGREYDVWTACFPPEMLARGKLLIGILDISADKMAKTALEMSEERCRSLLQFLPVAMLQVDRRELADVFKTLYREGVRDLDAYFREHPGFYEYAANSIQVIEVNQRTIKLFRARSADQLIGPADRVWSEARETIHASMAARFSGAARFEAEMKIRAFDDQTRDALYVAHFPEAYEREALGLICILDITDRVDAQAKLSRMQAEFSHAARVSMLGELTASIAHEVNQPLGAILTSGETTQVARSSRARISENCARWLCELSRTQSALAMSFGGSARWLPTESRNWLSSLSMTSSKRSCCFLGRSLGAKPCKRRSNWVRTSPLCGVTGSSSSRSSQISRSTRCRRWQASEKAACSSGPRSQTCTQSPPWLRTTAPEYLRTSFIAYSKASLPPRKAASASASPSAN
jgi:PAS domain-containing protein